MIYEGRAIYNGTSCPGSLCILDTEKEKAKMGFLADLWGFLKQRKKFWLLPFILITLLFAVLMVFASGSAIAPFIYTLF